MTNSVELRDWSSLPQDILENIRSYLSELEDVNRFRGVCKEWHQAVYPKDGFGSEWLLQKDVGDSILTLFHPLADMRKPCCIHVPPDVCHASIHGCKYGWLLMSRDYNDVFFYNPFSMSIISLPKLPPYKGRLYSFTCAFAPTSKDCLALVMVWSSKESIFFTISKGKSDWIVTTCTHEDFDPCHRNPAYHNDKFYYLDFCGKLGVFDPNSRTWSLYPKYHDIYQFHYFVEGYLIDFNGDLTSVFKTKSFEIEVFRWDECKLNWEATSDLGEYIIFLSENASFAKKGRRSCMRNAICLPMMCYDYGLFYSLYDGLYKPFRNDQKFATMVKKVSSEEKCKFSSKQKRAVLTKPFNCCWIEPAQDHCSSNLEWTSQAENSYTPSNS